MNNYLMPFVIILILILGYTDTSSSSKLINSYLPTLQIINILTLLVCWYKVTVLFNLRGTFLNLITVMTLLTLTTLVSIASPDYQPSAAFLCFSIVTAILGILNESRKPFIPGCDENTTTRELVFYVTMFIPLLAIV